MKISSSDYIFYFSLQRLLMLLLEFFIAVVVAPISPLINAVKLSYNIYVAPLCQGAKLSYKGAMKDRWQSNENKT